VELTLFVKVQLEHASNPRREIFDVLWNTSSDCLTLNLTSLSRKVSRNIEKRLLKQANITVTIDIADITHLENIPAQPREDDYLTDMCSSLSSKESKTPFLVVKYFATNAVQSDRQELRSRRTTLPTNTQGTNGSCVVVPMIVDLTKIFGDSIVEPKILDVSNCQGSCDLLGNGVAFSNHATIIQRFKLLNGGESPRDVSCVPTKYVPQKLIISQENYYVLTEFQEMIVTECGCH